MRLGPYLLGERLGLGGMAEVYVGARAGPHGFAKKFAIKRILPELAKDPRFVAMFVDEARICAGLQHPNIVQVVDFGESDGELFMTMEYVDGTSVARLLRSVAGRQQSFPLSILVLIARDVLRGLAYAHEATSDEGRPLGLVHRDVSPGNVLVSRAGEVKLGDFGIVRSEVVDRRTNPGELKGKLGYMSPEQVIGAEVDPRSDLFAAGILLAEMLITCPLFGGKNELEVLTRIHEADITTFTRRAKDLPAELVAITQRSLAREPRARFQSAREFVQALEAFTDSERLTLDHSELAQWMAGLGILPSRSGTHALGLSESGSRFAAVVPKPRATEPTEPGADDATPSLPQAVLNERLSSDPIDPLELVAIGRVRRQTKLVSRDGIGRPAMDVPSVADLLKKPAFQFGEPREEQATWSALVDAATLAVRLYDLAVGRVTGLLVARAEALERRVFFVDGEPRCVTSSLREELLGQRLLRRKVIDPQTLRLAIDARARGNLRLGEILVGIGAMPATLLLRELVEQLEDRFIELVGWRRGRLFFYENTRSGLEDLRAQLPALALVTRGVREKFGTEEIAELLLPYSRAPIAWNPAPKLDASALGLTAAEGQVLWRVGSAGTLERLVATVQNEGVATAPEALNAVFVGLAAGVLRTEGAGSVLGRS